MMLFGFGLGKWLMLYRCSLRESFRLDTNGKVVRPHQVETTRLTGTITFLYRPWRGRIHLADNRQDLGMHHLSGSLIQETCSPRVGLSDSSHESLLQCRSCWWRNEMSTV
jgi:hypothetical protein